MPEHIIGILGGMGPEATADLFREIILLTPAQQDQDHIPVLIYSNPKIPDRTRAIAEGGEDPLPLLIQGAQVLERAGAGILAVPCNTAHHYLPLIQTRIGIPILDMIAETIRDLKKRRPRMKAVGLLATTGTLRSGVYAAACLKHRLTLLVPEEVQQRQIQAAIRNVKGGQRGRAIGEVFESIGAALVQRGAESVILGCTEIPLAFDSGKVDYPSTNPTRVLAQAAVDWALERRG
jgi:aspartate racemase